jgi:ABC-type Fe3+/spermidine/putrescine transport system ATPase subunit
MFRRTTLAHSGESSTARAVSVHSVVKQYAGTTSPAVDEVSFDVEDGEFLVLLGPSGCGKTTSLRMIAGLEEPDAGEIWLGSRMVSSAEKNLFVPTEKRNIGMVFQSYAIWPHMTVFDNVAYPLRVRRTPKNVIRERVAATLQLIGLEGLESRPATMLSGGQQQRVALARAIVFEPRILLLDEPLSNLDAKLRVQMRTELKHLQQATGITSIFVTHDQAESMALADRIIVMNRGRIEQVGTPADIYERPKSRFVSEFVGSINLLHGVVTQISGSRLTLRYGDVEIECVAAPDVIVSDGDRVVASIRPEKLMLLREPSNGGANNWTGRVASVAYYGDHREYEIDVSDQLLKLNAPANVALDTGERVVVACDPDEVVVMPETAA